MVDINLTGVFNTIKAAAPVMIEHGRGGSIVHHQFGRRPQGPART